MKPIITCMRCGKQFMDENYEERFKEVKRIHCNECIDEIWGGKNA